MKIIGLNRIHNSALTLLDDGEVVFSIENERLSNIKYDKVPYNVIQELPKYTNNVDCIGITGVQSPKNPESFEDRDPYSSAIIHLNRSFYEHENTTYNLNNEHHKMHAAHGFYNSGFKNALCIIRDGLGSDYPIKHHMFQEGTMGNERNTSFIASYPNNFKEIDKEIMVGFECDVNIDSGRVTQHFSEGLAFQKTCVAMGMGEMDAGKLMGMSTYGKPNDSIPPMYIDDQLNSELFKWRNNNLAEGYLDFEFTDFQSKADFAYALQTATQNHVKKYIDKMIEQTGIKRVVLAGGYFLNCVANYEYLRDDVEFYIEPVSSDAGTSMGAAKYIHHTLTKDKTIRKQNHIYLGLRHSYIPEGIGADYDDIAKLIEEGKSVAIFQGRSEAGPRALGNRSILFDPRRVDGKDYINKIKGREWYRPFAGSVLLEHVHEYFDMRGLKESPFMMYAVNVKSDDLPAITHIDKTCRIQTVTKQQNLHYYNLIDAFKKRTGCPILFNTSFNLAGDCIVETYEDAVNAHKNSGIDYLYFPEFSILQQ